MKWTPITTEISLIFGRYTDRWFVIQKPHKWSLDKSSGAATVSKILEPFTPQGKVWFPLPMGRDNAGLIIVATDAPMYHILKSSFKNGKIGCRYRCLADISHKPGVHEKTNKRMHYESSTMLTSNRIKQFGSLWEDDGATLKSDGKLETNIQSRPFKYSLKSRAHTTDSQLDIDKLMANVRRTARSSKLRKRTNNIQEFEEGMNILLHFSPSKLRRFVQNESFPHIFNNTLRKSILAMSCEAKYSHMSVPASLSFELQSIGKSLPDQGEHFKTALYDVNMHTNAPHQLRVQFSEAGCPIYGDYLYHPKFNHWLVDDLINSNINQKPNINYKLGDPFGYENDELEINSTHNDDYNLEIPSFGIETDTKEITNHNFNLKQSRPQKEIELLHQRRLSNSLIYIQLYQLCLRDPLNPHNGQIYQFELDFPTEWKLVHNTDFS